MFYPNFGSAVSPQIPTVTLNAGETVNVQIPIDKQPISTIITQPIPVNLQVNNLPLNDSTNILPVAVQNFPSPQLAISVDNLPAIQTVSVNNIPSIQTVSVNNIPSVQTVHVDNFTAQATSITQDNQPVSNTNPFPIRAWGADGGLGQIQTISAGVTLGFKMPTENFDRLLLGLNAPVLYNFLINNNNSALVLPAFPGKYYMVTPLWAQCEITTQSQTTGNVWAFERTASFQDKKNPVVYNTALTEGTKFLATDEPGTSPVGDYYNRSLQGILVDLGTSLQSVSRQNTEFYNELGDSTTSFFFLQRAGGSSGLNFKLASDKFPPAYIDGNSIQTNSLKPYKLWALNNMAIAGYQNWVEKKAHFQPPNFDPLGNDRGVEQVNWNRPIFGAFRIDFIS